MELQNIGAMEGCERSSKGQVMEEKMEFHVFKKPKKLKNGKTVRRWYYYYVDESKKQVQRACRGCKTRKEAEDYIRAVSGGASAAAATALVKDIARDMFIPGGGHVERLAQFGRVYEVNSLLNARRYVGHIIEKWGERTLVSIDPTEVTRYLFTVDRSNQWKNRYKTVFVELYGEAQWRGHKMQKPLFESFTVHPRKADVLTTDELKRLFTPENFLSRMFYTMFLLCLSGGLRIGEVRAVRRRQIFFERKALLVDGFCKRDGTRTFYNKKGSLENPRHRITMLPDMALRELSEHISANSIGEEDFLFTENAGKPLTQDRAQWGFERAVLKSGIDAANRKIVSHSLRYTYVTRMRRELPAETVMKMVGHTSVEMTDYYTNKRAVDESIAALSSALHAADNLFV
jgi:integrase